MHGLGWKLLGMVITFFTLGLGYPWAYCFLYRWKINNTVIEGRRLRFTGNAVDLMVSWIKCLLFAIVTCGIYWFWVPRALREWQVMHTTFEDGALGNSSFDGTIFDYAGRAIIGGSMVVGTLGLGTAWHVCNMCVWEIDNAVIGGRRLKFTGTWQELFGKWIISWLLIIVTCGIYSLFVSKALYRWQVEHTTFAD